MAMTVAGENPNDPSAPFMPASTHWLRHTYAHKMLEASGNDLTIVKEVLGHASVATTAIYTKADIKVRMEAADRLKPSI